jgi:tetratricopeptide (TPR) repeat protein
MIPPHKRTPPPPDADAEITPIPGDATPTPATSIGRMEPTPRGPAPALPPGTELDGRYRIVRFIAAGGMGEVYEATDLALGAEVALKTIRPEVAARETVMERFRREILLARRVTHPNVCRIFDLGHHSLEDGGGITFLTMELLRGDTLRNRLREKGPLRVEEGLPVAAQMAAALDAAHAAGVVHRDLKAANVMLVPQPEGGPPRVVVTDFGLAWARDVDTSITRTDHIVGTAAYVAPEQAEGGEVTAAADIYAFGVVLYEMVTGRLPFEGDSPLSTVLKRFREEPVSPRDHVPGLHRPWETAILRCLEREPADRFASAGAVIAALRGETDPTATTRRPSRRHVGLAGGVLAALVLGAALAYLATRRPAAPGAAVPRAPAAVARRSVAVLGLKNLSGNAGDAWLSTALSEMFTAELAAGAKLKTVPGESVARMKTDLRLSDAETLGPETLTRIRAHSGADVVLLGSYLALGQGGSRRLRIDLRLQDSLQGETVATFTEMGTEAEVFDLVARAGGRLRQSLGVGDLSAADAGWLRAALPSNPDAARLYAEGLKRLRSFDALAARSLLEQATQADPGFAPAHSALAAAWSALGYDTKAEAAARRAFEGARDLSREEQLVIEGRFRETSREWPRAVEVYRTLWATFPDDLDHGLRLANAQISAGQAKDARETLAAVRKLPGSAAEDPRIDLTDALASEALGDFKTEAEQAAKAAAKASASGASLLRARARLAEAWAQRHLGRPHDATAASLEARGIYESAGDPGGVALSLLFLSNALEDEGDLAGARRAAEEGLAIRRRIGDDHGMARMLNILGNVLDAQGDTNGAKRRREEALALFKKVGNPYGVAVATFNLANIKAKTADHAGALADYEQALVGFRQVGNQMGIAAALTGLGNESKERSEFAAAKRYYEEARSTQAKIGDVGGQAICRINLGLMALLLGNLDESQAHYDEALRLTREAQHKSLQATTLSGLGELALQRGDLQGARKNLEQALAIRAGIGEERSAGESRVLLAAVAIEEGRAKEAEAETRDLPALFRKAASPDWGAAAAAVRARALLATGDVKGAQAELAAAAPQGRVVPPEVRYPYAVAEGRIRAATVDLAGGTKVLEAAAAEARRAGLKVYELEARLALGEVELAAGHKGSARARLRGVEAEAKALGLALLARRAAQSVG